MSVDVSRPEPGLVGAVESLRVRGGIAVAVEDASGRTTLVDLEERGGWRAKFPRCDRGKEAVFVNTGGGLLGGDRVTFDVAVRTGAALTIASQSAERVYRTLGAAADVGVRLTVESRGSLAWLPQPTILYDGARLARRIEADVAANATLLMCEAIIFGRAAMNEVIRTGDLRDRWEIRREGRLVFADSVRLDGDMQAALARTAIGAGARAAATVIHVAHDAEERRDAVREAVVPRAARCAVSAWNGLLTARLLAPDGDTLRADLIRVVSCLSRAPMPRVWNC